MDESKIPEKPTGVTRLNPPSLLDATAIGNSQISIADSGRLAFVAGQTATPRDGGSVPDDLPGQARIVARNLLAALDALEASPRDVVAFRMYVVNATSERFTEAWEPIREMMQGEMPSGTAIGVQSLWTPELQLEIEMSVRLP